jgi:hypothetical protein
MVEMAIIITYLVKYENSDGQLQELEVEVDCKDFSRASKDKALDETARRYLIGNILEQGGRVIKITKVDGLQGA